MDRETQIKRLRMRSWRRGMKEMDLILGPFSDTSLHGLSDEQLASYEVLLDENDQELYSWILAHINGREVEAPPDLLPLLRIVADDAVARLQPTDKV